MDKFEFFIHDIAVDFNVVISVNIISINHLTSQDANT